MNATARVDPRPEAMADVPGVCEIPVTRAIVQYRDLHEVGFAGGRIQDIGLALVLEGRFASAAECLDLGSGDVKLLDLSSELVVLDWAYEPTWEHVLALLRAVAATGERSGLERFSFRLALQVLERLGFGPLTRPTLVRIGFRDICRDLDLHDGTSVRIVMAEGRVVRAHMDYDHHALLFRTPTAAPDPALERILAEAFPQGDLRALVATSVAASGGYVVRFALPRTLAELRDQLALVRTGLSILLGRFEPARGEDVDHHLATFGRRDTLGRLRSGPAEVGPLAGLAARAPATASAEPAPAEDSQPGAFGSPSVH